ncbi:MAG TPA: hypothetical protein VJ867_15845 [Gemmatimonadaceae bacterium]|nr:hypothetical protein [Gemmatimonadaceae bacterium]
MIDKPDDVETLVERIARPLRATERVDSAFKNRVMSTIHGMTNTEPPVDTARLSPSSGLRMPERSMPSWWTRPYWIRVTPLAAIIVAVVVIALAVALIALRR